MGGEGGEGHRAVSGGRLEQRHQGVDQDLHREQGVDQDLETILLSAQLSVSSLPD